MLKKKQLKNKRISPLSRSFLSVLKQTWLITYIT